MRFKEDLSLIKLTPTHIRNRFYDTLAEMEKNRRLYVKYPEIDFTRSGTFTFQQTLLFITQMQSHSTNQELNTFFIPKNKQVTQSAFVQAKGKDKRVKKEHKTKRAVKTAKKAGTIRRRLQCA